MEGILDSIHKYGIIPVVKINDIKDALPMAKALKEGGIPCVEITFRTDAAEEAIRTIAREYPDMLVGAGTVQTVEQTEAAIGAGARFIVSPGLNPEIVQFCLSNNTAVIPGCVTPGEIDRAVALGLKIIKFFPAAASGGVEALKAISGPYGDVKFIPTGGLNADNFLSYLELPCVWACGGTWMVDSEYLAKGEFDKISSLAKTAVNDMLGFDFGHLGINTKGEEEAESIAGYFESVFGFEKKVGRSSILAKNGIEVIKKTYLGKNGHIAIKTNFIGRAVDYLERNGVQIDRDTSGCDDAGKLKSVYLKDEVGCFAVHLLQK
ncbi:MAG TPA: bifunctional 4-hydroxy-2-oxoglutarate aldolase/2-dehydro-3-deoxy-phosphogluconate aldolase [Anaerovoracaceae bacterium]|nr:bifunctional 4-hydroxy-2-oxoglutarate aldolase/2-dehydro-3-deoxy-phosphogluconate aldolase [Anaerovoracaceae bacterium]